ncbi:aminotransferase class V-fold PLP-dependent enzyme [Pseudonocardia kujensis]|uniref:aminotransferase class V-fold PLP-dependent enzyme n=1 Tax=Pseudonocardia kujensis TaxID=1128675 RepID=UPI001E5E8F89|nr:aminotransferase class V-fold PLP-dependent enzyme [Pseudonocardia kujensis]MCE0762740.1 aminotransferase class V-fold PLP-dependent enzyme [Pseudonocardia kujensis]
MSDVRTQAVREPLCTETPGCAETPGGAAAEEPSRTAVAATVGTPTTVSAPTALPELVGTGLPVPLVDGRSVPYANLDLAASAPALRAVADHVAELLPYYSSVHRGAGYASQVCTSVLEGARETVARFVGARGDDVVVFTRNTTDALNLLAGAVPGATLCLDVEHHATLLAWRGTAHRVLRAPDTVDETLALLRDALTAEHTALLAITGASNVTGEILPIDEICAIAHAAGTRVVLDAAQLAPHRRVDIAASGVDYVVLSGHKLYAPYGAGALIGRRDWLDVASPYLAGGGAVRSVGVEDRTAEVSWAPAPHRHEAGTPNVLGAAAIAAACRALDPVIDEVAPAHERALLARLVDGLSGIAGVRPLRIWADAPDRVAVASFTVTDVPAGLVAAVLSAEHGIGVRDGRFCAHPLLARLAGGADAVRVSLGLNTTADDVDRLVAAVRAIATAGPEWDYREVDGRWTPTPDPRDLDPLRLGAVVGPGGAACGH